MAETDIQAALASQHRTSLIAVVRHNRRLSMNQILEQLEGDDKAFIMDQPLEVFVAGAAAADSALDAADTVPDGHVEDVAPRRRVSAARAAKRGRKPKAQAATATKPAKPTKGGRGKKKAPPRPAAAAAANGKANGHAAKAPRGSSTEADAAVTKFIAKLSKGSTFKMGDLLKATGEKISRVTLISALNKLGKQIERQGQGRGTSYVVAG